MIRFLGHDCGFMMNSLHIRVGATDDAEALAELAERTFRDAFGADNPGDDMETYVRDTFSHAQVRAELAKDTNTYLLAFLDSDQPPIGYAKLRSGTHPSVSGPSPVQLQRLYVDQSLIGHGVGAVLMRECLATAESAGYETLWLGVWEHNEKSMIFYKRWGFEVVGENIFRLGSDDQIDLVMERAVPMLDEGEE